MLCPSASFFPRFLVAIASLSSLSPSVLPGLASLLIHFVFSQHPIRLLAMHPRFHLAFQPMLSASCSLPCSPILDIHVSTFLPLVAIIVQYHTNCTHTPSQSNNAYLEHKLSSPPCEINVFVLESNASLRGISEEGDFMSVCLESKCASADSGLIITKSGGDSRSGENVRHSGLGLRLEGKGGLGGRWNRQSFRPGRY